MSKRADRDFASDIREAIRRILAYTAGMTEAAFMADLRTQDAVMRNLEIMGEATKNLTEEFRDNMPTSRGKVWPRCAIGSSITTLG